MRNKTDDYHEFTKTEIIPVLDEHTLVINNEDTPWYINRFILFLLDLIMFGWI
jgi:hypothetical protein